MKRTLALLPLLLAGNFACGPKVEEGAAKLAKGSSESQSAPEPDTQPYIRIVGLEELEAEIKRRNKKGCLIDFWAIWCAPCVAELPELMATAKEFAGDGGVVLRISYDLMLPNATRDNVMPKMRDFVRKRKIHIPTLIFDDKNYDRINKRFDLPGDIPVTLALDKNGKIVDRQEGTADKERFDEMMRKALGR